MATYPQHVRATRMKCIGCNAPVVETVDDRFVCVECGAEPIQGDGIDGPTPAAD